MGDPVQPSTFCVPILPGSPLAQGALPLDGLAPLPLPECPMRWELPPSVIRGLGSLEPMGHGCRWVLGDTFPQSRHQETIGPFPQVHRKEFGNLHKTINNREGMTVTKARGPTCGLSWHLPGGDVLIMLRSVSPASLHVLLLCLAVWLPAMWSWGHLGSFNFSWV